MKIIDRYESRAANEDLFIMSISMQNHGGYTEKYDNFDEKVRLLGLNYPDVNQYLSLVHESDSALEYLISYFQNVDDPVEIVFFGDHQPSLSSSFYPNLNGKGLSGLTEDELEDRIRYRFSYGRTMRARRWNAGHQHQLSLDAGTGEGRNRASGVQSVPRGYDGDHSGNQFQRLLFQVCRRIFAYRGSDGGGSGLDPEL